VLQDIIQHVIEWTRPAARRSPGASAKRKPRPQEG
jgi:hypothetical protein